MKHILLAATFVFATQAAFAGAVSDPIVEPEVIVQDVAASAGQGWIIPLFFLLLLPFLNDTTTTVPVKIPIDQ